MFSFFNWHAWNKYAHKSKKKILENLICNFHLKHCIYFFIVTLKLYVWSICLIYVCFLSLRLCLYRDLNNLQQKVINYPPGLSFPKVLLSSTKERCSDKHVRDFLTSGLASEDLPHDRFRWGWTQCVWTLKKDIFTKISVLYLNLDIGNLTWT